MAEPAPIPMASRDVLAGYPLGHVGPAPRPPSGRVPSPRAAIEKAVLPALCRPPCVVAFSGGRDSSAVLAVAAHVARREGLPPPVPVTRVFADAPAAEEGDWQELVVRHLGLAEWVREAVVDEMDVIGPLARPRLLAHGVLWSPLLHGDDYFLRHARGGSVLDGEGGDDVCDPRPHRVTDVTTLLRRQRRVTRWRLRAAAGALAPARLRGRRAARRGLPVPMPWLRPAAVERVRALYGAHVAAEPLDSRRSILLVLARRSVVDLQRNRDFFARRNDTLFVSPFLTRPVAEALASAAGRLGFRSRADGLGTFCADLLPAAVLQRRTKAEFNATFFSRESRAFADMWSGAGVDPELVDHDALRASWRGPRHSALSAALLQAAWLADQPTGSSASDPQS